MSQSCPSIVIGTIQKIFHLGCAGRHQYAAGSRGSTDGVEGAEYAKCAEGGWVALMWCIRFTRGHAKSQTLTLPNTAPAMQQVSTISIKNHRANHLQAVLTEGNFPQDIAQADREHNGHNGPNTFPEDGTALAFCEAKSLSNEGFFPFLSLLPPGPDGVGWFSEIFFL